tara:strand:- start:2432 stop:3442 length:1011 start_codon:yes stop_codon:yes gene_type:complete
MATLRDIKGDLVEKRSANPDNPQLGDIWYRTDTGNVQLRLNLSAWATGGTMNTARELGASIGTAHNASIVGAGYNGSTHVNNVESYDGTSWTEIAEVNTARYYCTGLGSSTAGLVAGGTPPVTSKTEIWNGSSWTEVNDLTRGPSSPQAPAYMSGSGTSTSGLVYAGDEGASNKSALTESWDGTNWTEVADLNTGRSYAAGSGTSNSSALLISGFNWTPSLGGSPLVEQYNGSSWTEVGDVNTGRGRIAASNFGGVSTTIAFGGSPNNSTLISSNELWDGSSWTETTDLSSAKWAHFGSGTGTNALASGGANPTSSRLATTEEWTVAATTQKATVS